MRRAGLALLMTAFALWSANAAAQPVTVRDAFGREVTVPAPPQRIVTIFASNTEMVVALGLANRIVGIEAFTRFPPEVLGKPLVGGRLGNGLLLIARPGTYTGDAVLMAGGRFALDSGAIAQISPEAVLKSDPDVLLFAGSDKDLKELIARPGWTDMRAVRGGRAFAVVRAELLIPGPRTIAGVEKLAAVLHPPAAARQ